MRFTDSQIDDIKLLIQKSISEIINDAFLSGIVTKVSEKVDIYLQHKFEEQDKKISELVNANEQLLARVQHLERNSKVKNLRIYGLSYEPGEDLEDKVTDMINNKLQVNLTPIDIEHCYRVGDKTTQKTQVTILKLNNYKHKKLIVANRRKLKGTGITIAEDLDRQSHKLLKMAMEKFGNKNVWTLDGIIFARKSGRRYKINSITDLN